MSIFVTGATGYLGQAVIRTLRARDPDVRALVRPGSDLRKVDLTGVHVVLGDVNDKAAVKAGMSGCKSVVHMAAAAPPDGPKQVFEETNIAGFRTVMDAAFQAGVALAVHVSSFLAIGPSLGAVADEEHRTAERKLMSPFERTARAADALARSYVSGGLPLATVYPGLVYGPGEGRGGNLGARLTAARAHGRLPPLCPDFRLSFVHVDDVAGGINRVLERALPGERFLLSGENLPLTGFFDALEKASGPGVTRVLRPGESPIAKMGRFVDRLRGRDAHQAQLINDLVSHDWAYRADRAARRLGWTPRPVKEGLRNAALDLLKPAAR